MASWNTKGKMHSVSLVIFSVFSVSKERQLTAFSLFLQEFLFTIFVFPPIFFGIISYCDIIIK